VLLFEVMANEIPRVSNGLAMSGTSALPSGSIHAFGHGQPPPVYYAAAVARPQGYGDRGQRASQSHIPLNKSRRLYVGNIPYHVGIADNGMVQLFSALYVAAFRPLAPSEPLPVSSFWLHADGKFGFMELRGDAEAVDIMQLNGLVLHGRALRVNRPSDYRPEVHGPASVTPSKINVVGLLELCSQLSGIVAPPAHVLASAAMSSVHAPPHLMRSEEPPQSPVGHASAVPPASPQLGAAMSTNSSTAAISGGLSAASAPLSFDQQSAARIPVLHSGSLQEAEIESDLQAERASSALPDARYAQLGPETQDISPPLLRSQPQQPPGGKAGDNRENEQSDVPPSFIVCLRNLVTDEDLDGNQDDYDDIIEDVRDECSRYGSVVGINIPRKGRGRGTAFIAYQTLAEASQAIEGLRKLVFSGRSIEALIVPDVSSVEQAAANLP
jgi:splicing factor U2AF 65 kDa subunit